MQLAQQIMQAMRKPVNTRLFRERLNQGGNDVDFSKCPVASMEREFRPEFVVGATGVLRTQTSVEMVIAAIALERYFIRFHKYPSRLADLQPSFVAHVPIDYMDGAELRYRLRDDGSYLLYSVGHNGIDDGGDPNPVEKGMPLNFITARDWVWPAAATPEEVSAYEKGARKKAK
jgi:hypothetical protein